MVEIGGYWIPAFAGMTHEFGRRLRMMPESDDIRRTVTVRIEGRVQGVYYRAWTEETARSLGLDGTVRNTSDGNVEAVFSGPPETVVVMLRRCEQGPKDARVTKVTILKEGGVVAPGFKVLGTDWQRR
jgi:acylphosphatase